MEKITKFPIIDSQFLTREICDKIDCPIRNWFNTEFTIQINKRGVLKCIYPKIRDPKIEIEDDIYTCFFERLEALNHTPSFKTIYQFMLFEELKKRAIKKWSKKID